MSNFCNICDLNKNAKLRRGRDETSNSNFTIALAGNPNTGKSTLFNVLTGLKQYTGNWPGKTVTSALGSFFYQDKKFKLVDLPGTYSLLSTSEDEEIARDFILFNKPDIIIVICDGSRLERNLNLAIQISQISSRVIVCLNLMDEVRRHHMKIDIRVLSKELGVPVVPISARRHEGIEDLLQVIYNMAMGNIVTKPHKLTFENKEIQEVINTLVRKIKNIYPDLSNPQWIAMRLLEGDQSIIRALKNNTFSNL